MLYIALAGLVLDLAGVLLIYRNDPPDDSDPLLDRPVMGFADRTSERARIRRRQAWKTRGLELLLLGFAVQALAVVGQIGGL